jgi:hypothetical protein
MHRLWLLSLPGASPQQQISALCDPAEKSLCCWTSCTRWRRPGCCRINQNSWACLLGQTHMLSRGMGIDSTWPCMLKPRELQGNSWERCRISLPRDHVVGVRPGLEIPPHGIWMLWPIV